MSNLDNLKTSVTKIKTYIDDKNTARIAAESDLSDGVMIATNNAATAQSRADAAYAYAGTATNKAESAQEAASEAQTTADAGVHAASAANAANTTLDNKIYGTTPTAVKKAIGDGNNNNIVDTYLRKNSHGVGGFAPLDTNSKIPASYLHVGEAYGLVPLNGSLKIDPGFIPSTIDDIVAMDTVETEKEIIFNDAELFSYVNTHKLGTTAVFGLTDISSTIFYTVDTNKTYRVSTLGHGDYKFVEISASLGLGTSPSSAYRGSDGAANRASIHGNADGIMTLFETAVQSVAFNFTTSVTTVSASITGTKLTINIPKNLSVYTNNAGFVTATTAAATAQTKVDALSTDVCNAIDFVF